ncbi:MAG: hypothetical protein ACLP6E_08720, partial [Acidimicrobiales bacterium]
MSSNQASGVAHVLALAAIMKGSTQPVTAAGIKTQTETATNVVIPLSGGLTFTCNVTAIPVLKSVCSLSAAIGVIQSGKSGKVIDIKVYNPTPLSKGVLLVPREGETATRNLVRRSLGSHENPRDPVHDVGCISP